MEMNGTYSYGPTVVAGRNCFRYAIADRAGRIFVDAIAETEELVHFMIRAFLGAF